MQRTLCVVVPLPVQGQLVKYPSMMKCSQCSIMHSTSTCNLNLDISALLRLQSTFCCCLVPSALVPKESGLSGLLRSHRRAQEEDSSASLSVSGATSGWEKVVDQKDFGAPVLGLKF